MKRKRSLKALKRDLDAKFSRWIRNRDCDDGGVGMCVTCGKNVLFSEGHAGHFVPRQYLATRYDERNVHLQCAADNVFRHGALTEYTLFMLKEYGQSVVDELLQAKHKTVRMRREDYEALLSKYDT